jgi:hypothetical protein
LREQLADFRQCHFGRGFELRCRRVAIHFGHGSGCTPDYGVRSGSGSEPN